MNDYYDTEDRTFLEAQKANEIPFMRLFLIMAFLLTMLAVGGWWRGRVMREFHSQDTEVTRFLNAR